MAKLNVEKKYYNNVNEALAPVNENNRFYNEINNAIKSGKQEIYQKRIKETRTFDATWVEAIEGYLSNIDNIIRNPRMFMEGQEDVVRIERAKKITSRTIAHLSAHTENVETIRDDGVVVPNKVLSMTYEDKLAIYENRFVVTLISKLAAFIEIRYDAIKDSIITYQSDRLNVVSNFKWRNFDVNCNVDVKLTQEVDDDLNRKNKEMFARIENIRNYVHGFVNTQFFKTVRNSAAPVVSPILRTNIILKQIDYNACLQLWQFLDSYRQLGFDVDVAEKTLEFDEAYENAVINMITYNYATLAANQEERSKQYHLKPYKYHKIKDPKVVTNIVNEYMESGSIEMEKPSSNEYFYQKTVDAYSDKFEALVQSGKSSRQAITTIYKQMQGIANSTYKDIIKQFAPNIKEDATYSERKKENYLYTKKKYSLMKSIAYLKQVEAENAIKELERLEAAMEKYQRLEKQYQEELKQMRKESLKKAREARKNIVIPEKERIAQEELNLRRLAAMQAGRDRAKFERDRKAEEERLLKEARLRELQAMEEAIRKEREEMLKEEARQAALRVKQEEKERLLEKLDKLSANPSIWVNYDALTADEVDLSQVVLRIYKDRQPEQELVSDVSSLYEKESEITNEVEEIKEEVVVEEKQEEVSTTPIIEEKVEEVETTDESKKGIKGFFKKIFKK